MFFWLRCVHLQRGKMCAASMKERMYAGLYLYRHSFKKHIYYLKLSVNEHMNINTCRNEYNKFPYILGFPKDFSSQIYQGVVFHDPCREHTRGVFLISPAAGSPGWPWAAWPIGRSASCATGRRRCDSLGPAAWSSRPTATGAWAGRRGSSPPRLPRRTRRSCSERRSRCLLEIQVCYSFYSVILWRNNIAQ